jgi:phospholipid/cholesterol/gamma-HCH transport system permease protein
MATSIHPARREQAEPLDGERPLPDGPLRAFGREAGELLIFSWQILRALPGTTRYFAEVMRQAAAIVRGTSVLLLVMNVFLGISVANFGYFFLRSLGAGDYVGVVTGLLAQRQTSVTMFGYVIAAKVCCGFAAELGAAKIQQEIDAYESTGVDPRQLIVGTRLLAVILFVPLATVISLIGQNLGAFLAVVTILQGNSAQTFTTVTFSVQSVIGEFYSLLTILSIAVPCTLVACFYGLRTGGGPASVGSSVARSLMVNLILVHVISAFCGVLFYANNIRIPIAS